MSGIRDIASRNPFGVPPTKRNLSAAAPSDQYSCEFGSAKYYALCGFGGILSCGITHTLVVPLDLVKCRIQVSIILYNITENILTPLSSPLPLIG